MKKLLCAVIAVLTLMTAAVPVSAFISESEYAALLGDVNGDGVIDSKDIITVKRSIADVAGTEIQLSEASADVDGDAKISARDVYFMKAYAAEAIDTLAPSASPVGRLNIGGYDARDFVITYPADANENVRFAAGELQKYLLTAIGEELPIEVDSTALHAFRFAVSEELGVEGIDVLCSDGNIYLTGGTLRGCMYAVYDFLERYVGWVFINHENEFINENQQVTIKDGSHYRHIPKILDRDSQTWSYQNDNKKEHLEAALKMKISSWKNRGALEKSEKYGYSVGYVGSAHMMATYAPSFVPDNSSKTCWSTPEMLDECLENVLAKIKSVKDRGYNCDKITVAPMDNDKYCECRNCKKANRANGSVMGSQLTFINDLASKVALVYPDVHIMTTAYWITRRPPTSIVPAENVDILYCWGGCTNHCVDGEDCTEKGNYLWYTNINERTYFEKWAEITKGSLYIWLYATSYTGFLAEPAMFNHMRQDIKYFADAGVEGIYCEGYYNTSDDFKDGDCFDLLTMYMYARLQWDPDMSEEDYDSYINEYLKYYYGDGWEYVLRYLQMNEEATEALGACSANNADLPFDQLSFDYFKDHAEEMFLLADNALALAKTEAEIEHTTYIATNIYWLCLSATCDDLKGDEATVAKYSERYLKLHGWMVKYNIVNLNDEWENFDPNDTTVRDPYEWNYFVTEKSKPYHNLRKSKDPLPSF